MRPMLITLSCTLAIAMNPLPKLDWSVPRRFAKTTVLNRAKAYPEKWVALTFDDGPDPKVTPRILSTLKKYGAKATFFVLGPAAKRHPQLLQRMVLEGHCIGNHSWTHAKDRTPKQAAWEVSITSEVVRKATGNVPTLFRPPYGIRDGSYVVEAKRRGMPIVLWSNTNADTKVDDPKKMAGQIGLPRNGEIILCHDGPGKEATAKMLPLVLKRLKKEGYTFVTLPTLLRSWDTHIAKLENKERLASIRSSKVVAMNNRGGLRRAN